MKRMNQFPEDERPRPRQAHIVGEALDTISVDEIDRRIALLEEEIARLKVERTRKVAMKGDAEALFRV